MSKNEEKVLARVDGIIDDILSDIELEFREIDGYWTEEWNLTTEDTQLFKTKLIEKLTATIKDKYNK